MCLNLLKEISTFAKKKDQDTIIFNTLVHSVCLSMINLLIC
jgi:hypothetical protein